LLVCKGLHTSVQRFVPDAPKTKGILENQTLDRCSETSRIGDYRSFDWNTSPGNTSLSISPDFAPSALALSRGLSHVDFSCARLSAITGSISLERDVPSLGRDSKERVVRP